MASPGSKNHSAADFFEAATSFEEGSPQPDNHVAMNIKDRIGNREEIDSPYEMMKEYFKNFGMRMGGSKTFDMAVTNLEQWMKRNKMMKLTERQLRKIIREEIESITKLNENSVISKLNAVKSKLSPLSSLYIQSIIDDKGVIEDLDNTGNFVTIEDIKLWGDNKLVLTYRLYNKKSESGGYQTIASFYGDVDEILSNLNHLIFNVVYSRKKKFEDIKIDFKTNNKVANKYRYDNRFNESMNEFVNVDDYLKDGGYEFLHSYGLATLKYGGKVIAKGGEDFHGVEDGYLMKHSSWRDEKVFDTARDVIDYFKKRRIKRK